MQIHLKSAKSKEDPDNELQAFFLEAFSHNDGGRERHRIGAALALGSARLSATQSRLR
jgi:hypothetical protein